MIAHIAQENMFKIKTTKDTTHRQVVFVYLVFDAVALRTTYKNIHISHMWIMHHLQHDKKPERQHHEKKSTCVCLREGQPL